MTKLNSPSPGSTTGGHRFAGRTRLITFASVIAVGFAAAIAVGANLGILNAADAGEVGSVAAADLVPQVQTVDASLGAATTASGTATTVSVPSPSSTIAAGATSASSGQEFAVDSAGMVTVGRSGQGIRLDALAPTAGWTWSLAQSGDQSFTVTFTNGTRTLEFLAQTTPDGTVSASVTEPVPAATAASTGSGERHGDDDDEGEHDYKGGEDDD